MNNVVILQARTSSSRLPGKVLLPLKGTPLVVLAAKRAGNTGKEVIVATSDDPSDDGLANIIAEYGLTCYRGSLHNTLSRIVGALESYTDETIVFRLTGDNVFPDGKLLDDLQSEFIGKGVKYMNCNGIPSGLPYGMSAEVTYLGLLREAMKYAVSEFDCEHVTPYIIRKYGFSSFEKYQDLNRGNYRCTVDCLDDYLVQQAIFLTVDDAVGISCFDLLSILADLPNAPVVRKPLSKFVLGTAQLGMVYGAANVTGQPSRDECKKIIKTAIANGVNYIDSARAYGLSEQVIASSLKDGWQGRAKVITKLLPLDKCPLDATEDTVKAYVDASVYKSCACLGVQTLDVLMLHRASNLDDWNGAAWTRLLDLKADGIISELGVSVQSPLELMKALEESSVSFIQFPFNILDWRWDDCIKEIIRVKQTRPLIVHVRSVLLQGLLPSSDKSLWERADVQRPLDIIQWLQLVSNKFKRRGVVDLCLAYVSSMDWVDGVVVGVESYEQLKLNIRDFSSDRLEFSERDWIAEHRPELSVTNLNPALWRAK